MSEETVKIAIVGSGPGGIGAAVEAASLGVSHVLFEATEELSNTIFRYYQKGKYVEDNPKEIDLQRQLSEKVNFVAGAREQVLGEWRRGIEDQRVNVRYRTEITAISGSRGSFQLTTAAGETVHAEQVVMGIGMQGNPRKLGVEGQDLPFVKAYLEDAAEHADKTIVVVGAGNAAIEDAVALAAANEVIIVNRGNEFSRASAKNLNDVTRAIGSGNMQCFYGSSVAQVIEADPEENDGHPGKITLKTPNGPVEKPVDMIITRIGAVAPRKFVESCGIEFPSQDASAIPQISDEYESNVDGLYIVGALAGYPLIKQAMNQGYEAVRFICKEPVVRSDEPLLKAKIKAAPAFPTVADALAAIRNNVPIFSEGITTLQLRELLLYSTLHQMQDGEVVFEKDDYTNSFFSIIHGSVGVRIDPNDAAKLFTIAQGNFFGEMGLLSGRPRSATIVASGECVLLETPRRTMLKFIRSTESLRRTIDDRFLARAIQTQIAPNIGSEDLEDLAAAAAIRQFAPGEYLYKEGDEANHIHLLRVGSVTLSRQLEGEEVVVSYLPAGKYVGEIEVVNDIARVVSVKATVQTETIALPRSPFRRLLATNPELAASLEAQFDDRLTQFVRMANEPVKGHVISYLVDQGLGEATNVLVIDEGLCIRCDFCEKACAETHDGFSRLNREAGPTFASMHVPIACRHCENPHCMKDCPPDAINRAPNGEVFINDDCIGCGNCQANCPYGVIQMAALKPRRSGILSWLLFGAGHAPGEHAPNRSEGAKKKAVKCDQCKDVPGGPACVRACPTGAAIRMSPEQFQTLKPRPELA